MATQRPPSVSRLSQARAAIRPQMKGRLMLAGPAGAGKTYTSLLIATYLVGEHGRILHIDTEKESSLTYADVFTFEHLRWNAPYDPTALAVTIMEAGSEYDCIIVDSFSHFWQKEGGILDIAAGQFTNWKNARPMQEDVTEAILETDAHTIVCCRSKMEHVQEQGTDGKWKVRKIGMKAVQDDNLEFEVNIALEVDMQHVLAISKSRTAVIPVGRTFQPAHAGDFASEYRDWLKGGEPVAKKEDTDELAAMLNTITDPAERHKAKLMFLDFFGRPEFLLVSRLEEAKEWVVERVAGVVDTPNRAEGDAPDEDRARAEAGTEDKDRISQQPGMVPHAFAGTGVICTTCKAGKGHPLHQAPAEGDTANTAATTADPVEKPGEAPTAPEGEPQEGAAPDVEPAPGSTPDAAPPDDATAKALDRVKELEETAARSDSKADAEKVRKELIGSIVKWVSELPMAEIVKQLESRKFSTNGIPRVLRDALVDFYVNVAEGRTVDPLICEDCGGYQLVPPPFLEESKRCGCPI